jgi:hypothetical protein
VFAEIFFFISKILCQSVKCNLHKKKFKTKSMLKVGTKGLIFVLCFANKSDEKYQKLRQIQCESCEKKNSELTTLLFGKF